MNKIILNVNQENIEKRLDVYLFENFKNYSRTFFKNIILEQDVIFVNNRLIKKPNYLVKANDKIEFSFSDIKNLNIVNINTELINNLDVKILYENEDFLILYKPAKLNTHRPNTKNKEAALTDWLIDKFNQLKEVGYIDRPGIVHRLDKDTSGILIIAKNSCSHIILSDMFKNRKIEKTYIAVVKGHPEESGFINFKIKRDNIVRIKMKADISQGRDALTYYKVIKYLKDNSIVQVNPVTGRTHQIRVHFSAIKHPIIADSVYGEKSEFIDRQALHAYKISFFYKGKYYMFLCDIPKDIKELIDNIN